VLLPETAPLQIKTKEKTVIFFMTDLLIYKMTGVRFIDNNIYSYRKDIAEDLLCKVAGLN